MEVNQSRTTRSMLKKEFLEDPAKEAAFNEAWKKSCSEVEENKKTTSSKKNKNKNPRSDKQKSDLSESYNQMLDRRTNEVQEMQTSPSGKEDRAGANPPTYSDQGTLVVNFKPSSTRELFRVEDEIGQDSCTISSPSVGKKATWPQRSQKKAAWLKKGSNLSLSKIWP